MAVVSFLVMLSSCGSNPGSSIVLDEAHLIRNNGKMALSVRKLRGNRLVALTGAPVQNSIDDLDNLLEFVSGPITVVERTAVSHRDEKEKNGF